TLLTLAVLVLCAVVGCAKPPQDEVNAAQAEMDRARQANADTWAPTEAKAAEEAMTAARGEISARNGKWMKKYDKANGAPGPAQGRRGEGGRGCRDQQGAGEDRLGGGDHGGRHRHPDRRGGAEDGPEDQGLGGRPEADGERSHHPEVHARDGQVGRRQR